LTYIKHWLPELVGLIVLSMISTIPFWLYPLDITVANAFFVDESSLSGWPLEHFGIFSFLFWLAPWLTVILGLIGLLVLSIGILKTKRKRFRLYGMFIFLSVLVGPGLVVNALFKDNWDRPRPREVQVFGGEELYVPPLMPGQVGNSFPCGHCSVAFAVAMFYLVWRRRYPRRAIIALSISIALGSLMGIARIAAGGHFLSDVLWSAVLTWSTLMLLYWPIMRIPWREDTIGVDSLDAESKVMTCFKLTLIALVAITGVVFTWRMY
tara:strand:+ start:3501 stop:4298 length:798 start_codon:yes stop_codon:yes gene_type:complete